MARFLNAFQHPFFSTAPLVGHLLNDEQLHHPTVLISYFECLVLFQSFHHLI